MRFYIFIIQNGEVNLTGVAAHLQKVIPLFYGSCLNCLADVPRV